MIFPFTPIVMATPGESVSAMNPLIRAEASSTAVSGTALETAAGSRVIISESRIGALNLFSISVDNQLSVIGRSGLKICDNKSGFDGSRTSSRYFGPSAYFMV